MADFWHTLQYLIAQQWMTLEVGVPAVIWLCQQSPSALSPPVALLSPLLDAQLAHTLIS